jgi:hypothetical protein
MGTQRVQMKEVLPWLVLWSRRAGTRDFYPALAAQVSQYKIFFPHRTLFKFMCPHRPATLAGSRAGPPVSECVSPFVTAAIFKPRENGLRISHVL